MTKKEIYHNYHLSLYKTNRGFIYAQRRGVNSTACLCFKKDKNGHFRFLIRYQPLPILKGKKAQDLDKNLYPCCITGSIEPSETPINNAIKEILEEAGIKVTKKSIVDCIKATASTQMNEVVYHYLVDVTNAPIKNTSLGDGSYFETISINKWISEKQLINIVYNNKELFLSSLAICYSIFIKHYH